MWLKNMKENLNNIYIIFRYQNAPNKLVDVDFEGEWTASSDYFDYDTDLYPATVIRSIAKEKWTREYFEGLKT